MKMAGHMRLILLRKIGLQRTTRQVQPNLSDDGAGFVHENALEHLVALCHYLLQR